LKSIGVRYAHSFVNRREHEYSRTLPTGIERWNDTQAIESCVRVDILVNNVGVGTAVPTIHVTTEQFRQVMDVNLMGAYWMSDQLPAETIE
jgi:NAD(P)-dependent dehydrogenase (short-subunit alcohol dehydrogenase family)